SEEPDELRGAVDRTELVGIRAVLGREACQQGLAVAATLAVGDRAAEPRVEHGVEDRGVRDVREARPVGRQLLETPELLDRAEAALHVDPHRVGERAVDVEDRERSGHASRYDQNAPTVVSSSPVSRGPCDSYTSARQ